MWMVIRWRDTGVIDAVQITHVRVTLHRVRARSVSGETFLASFDRAEVTFSSDDDFPAGLLNTEISKWEYSDD